MSMSAKARRRGGVKPLSQKTKVLAILANIAFSGVLSDTEWSILTNNWSFNMSPPHRKHRSIDGLAIKRRTFFAASQIDLYCS